MNIGKVALAALLGSALVAFGCSDDSSGSGGGAGAGNTGGAGGPSDPGGAGGSDGAGGAGEMCKPVEQRCTSAASEAIEPCCDLDAPPEQENACDGTERLENPESCAAAGKVVPYKLTFLAVDEDCNSGYDLDSCDGLSCLPGTIAAPPNTSLSPEGIDGVDNGLASIQNTIPSGVGRDLSDVQQALSNSLCGLTDDPESGTCEDDTSTCTCATAPVPPLTSCMADDCAGISMGVCELADDDCMTRIPALELSLEVDANTEENCANVTITSGETTTDVILNISELTAGGTACASGTLGDLRLVLGGAEVTFGNAVIRVTVSESGFSDGLLGATADEETARTITSLISPIAEGLVQGIFDINDDLSGDASAACNAVSLTVKVGGVAVVPVPQ